MKGESSKMITPHHRHFVACLVLSVTLFACRTPDNPVPGESTSEVSAHLLTEPALFGVGALSTASPEFATSFSPDGRTVFFNRMDDERTMLRIYSSTFSEGTWTTATPLPFSDGTYRDVDPFVTTDGSRLYFSSNRPLDGDAPNDNFDTWYVGKAPDGWSDPVNPGAPLNSDANEFFVSATSDGTLYFSLPDDGVSHIYRSRVLDGQHQAPERVVLGVADSVDTGNPLVAPDESFLIFVSASLPGEGGADLFISVRDDSDGWSLPRNLGSRINSSFSDFAPGLSPDGKYLYFTSERPGIVGPQSVGRPPGDLYQVLLSSILE